MTWDRIIDRAGRIGLWIVVLCTATLVVFLFRGRAEDRETASDRAEQIASLQSTQAQLAAGVEALRAQIEACKDEPPGTPGCEEPVVPPAGEIVDDPGTPPAGFDPAVVRAIAVDVLADLLPGAADDEVEAAVDDAIAECVTSGACVGPGPDPEQVAALVSAAVAAFCADGACQGQTGPAGPQGPAGEPGPPGADGCCTEQRIRELALEQVITYLSGRGIYCDGPPPSNEAGWWPITCYVSSG